MPLGYCRIKSRCTILTLLIPDNDKPDFSSEKKNLARSRVADLISVPATGRKRQMLYHARHRQQHRQFRRRPVRSANSSIFRAMIKEINVAVRRRIRKDSSPRALIRDSQERDAAALPS